MDVKKLEHRRKPIDSFINSIYLFDDHMVITFNYKDGAKTITFEEIENTINGSDLAGFGAPTLRPCISTVSAFFFVNNHTQNHWQTRCLPIGFFGKRGNASAKEIAIYKETLILTHIINRGKGFASPRLIHITPAAPLLSAAFLPMYHHPHATSSRRGGRSGCRIRRSNRFCGGSHR